jgi:hypothetical protein
MQRRSARSSSSRSGFTQGPALTSGPRWASRPFGSHGSRLTEHRGRLAFDLGIDERAVVRDVEPELYRRGLVDVTSHGRVALTEPASEAASVAANVAATRRKRPARGSGGPPAEPSRTATGTPRRGCRRECPGRA